MPDSLMESAYIDGANDLVILFRIVAPLIKPTLAVLLLYYGVGHWNSWFNASIYLQDNSKLPIQNIMRAILIANSNVLNSAAAENDQVNQFAESIKYSTNHTDNGSCFVYISVCTEIFCERCYDWGG